MKILLSSVNFWLVVGLVFASLEIVTGVFIALSFGISAFIMAGVFYFWPNIFDHWYEIAFVYSILSVGISSVFWYWRTKVKVPGKDINDQDISDQY